MSGPQGGIFFDSHCRGATSNTVDYDYINLMTVIIKQPFIILS